MYPTDANCPVAATVLLTVAMLGVDVPGWPAVSYALHVKVWLPLAALAVFQVMLYGARVAVPRSSEPSHQNSTRLTPWSSLAVPAKVAVPPIVAPLPGEVRLAVGGLSGVAPASETLNV